MVTNGCSHFVDAKAGKRCGPVETEGDAREGIRVLRCFVAVEVGAGLRRAMEATQATLRRGFGTSDPVKWVPAHQFHFTLKFLGEISEEAAGRAGGAVDRAVRSVSPFTLSLAGLGAFPQPERPAVLWAGVANGRERLAALAAAVERELVAEGFPAERRRFQPHLTLGRVREGASVPRAVVENLARQAGQEFGAFRVERVVLMRSELTPRGPIYSVLHSAPLREEIP